MREYGVDEAKTKLPDLIKRFSKASGSRSQIVVNQLRTLCQAQAVQRSRPKMQSWQSVPCAPAS